MSAIPYESGEEDWEGYDESDEAPDFGRQRRRKLFTRASAVLLALLLGAVGFYVGVRVEKGQLSSSSTSTTGAGALASALGGARTGAGGATGASSASGASGASRFAGAGARAGGGGAFGAGALGGGGAFGGAGGGSFGTVSSVSGDSLYVTESSGNVVKVTLSGATKVTKSQSVSKSAIRPGDTVVIQGIGGSKGTISASSVTDAGARSTGTGAGSGGASAGGSSSGSSGSSAVNSLFGGG